MNTTKRTLATAIAAAALAISPAARSLQPQEPKAAAPASPGFWIGPDPAPAGTIPWQLLQQAKTVQKPDKKFGPVFTKEIGRAHV